MFGFGEHFISMIKTLYHSPAASVITVNIISPPFPLQRGTRQGCPLSPLSSLALNGGGRIFFSPSSPLFSLLALLSCLVSSIERLSLHCSPNWKNYGFDQLVSQRNWHHLLDEKLGFWGTWLPWRNVCSWLHDGRVERVAYHVFSGSFRGGHWRYLPIRNHDNRSFADRIRLCPGLSKNSENGNSCPKPHKAARHDWSSGKSGQHWDWDY